MKKTKKIALLAACVCAVAVAPTHVARATFIVNPTPGGPEEDHVFVDMAHHNVSTFEMFVGGNKPTFPHVTVTTIGPVDTGGGWATIKPIHMGNITGPLTSLTFTPQVPTMFGDFSFRGQLFTPANGTVTLTVQDNQGDPAQTFMFSGLGHDADFTRQGIIEVLGSGETIKSITLTSDFKEVKQIEFSLPGVLPPPVPDGGATVMLMGMALGGLGLVRRFLTRRT